MDVSNTDECFKSCIGKKVIGVLFEYDQRFLIFDDKTALTVTNSGDFWIEDKETMIQKFRKVQAELTKTQDKLARVLSLAGVLAD